jgi:hypothetical protein
MSCTSHYPFSFTLKAEGYTPNAKAIIARNSYTLKPRENATEGTVQISRASVQRSALSVQRILSLFKQPAPCMAWPDFIIAANIRLYMLHSFINAVGKQNKLHVFAANGALLRHKLSIVPQVAIVFFSK